MNKIRINELAGSSRSRRTRSSTSSRSWASPKRRPTPARSTKMSPSSCGGSSAMARAGRSPSRSPEASPDARRQPTPRRRRGTRRRPPEAAAAVRPAEPAAVLRRGGGREGAPRTGRGQADSGPARGPAGAPYSSATGRQFSGSRARACRRRPSCRRRPAAPPGPAGRRNCAGPSDSARWPDRFRTARPGQVLSGPRQPIAGGRRTNRCRPSAPISQRPGVPARAPGPALPHAQVRPPPHHPESPDASGARAAAPARPLAGQPAARPVVPPRPDLVGEAQPAARRGARHARAALAGPSRGPGFRAPQSAPAPGQPIYRGPIRPGQPVVARQGPAPGVRPGTPMRPGGPRPMHPTSRRPGMEPAVAPPPPDQQRRPGGNRGRPQQRDRSARAGREDPAAVHAPPGASPVRRPSIARSPSPKASRSRSFPKSWTSRPTW